MQRNKRLKTTIPQSILEHICLESLDENVSFNLRHGMVLKSGFIKSLGNHWGEHLKYQTSQEHVQVVLNSPYPDESKQRLELKLKLDLRHMHHHHQSLYDLIDKNYQAKWGSLLSWTAKCLDLYRDYPIVQKLCTGQHVVKAIVQHVHQQELSVLLTHEDVDEVRVFQKHGELCVVLDVRSD